MTDSFSPLSFSPLSFSIYDIGDAGTRPIPARINRSGGNSRPAPRRGRR